MMFRKLEKYSTVHISDLNCGHFTTQLHLNYAKVTVKLGASRINIILSKTRFMSYSLDFMGRLQYFKLDADSFQQSVVLWADLICHTFGWLLCCLKGIYLEY